MPADAGRRLGGADDEALDVDALSRAGGPQALFNLVLYDDSRRAGDEVHRAILPANRAEERPGEGEDDFPLDVVNPAGTFHVRLVDVLDEHLRQLLELRRPLDRSADLNVEAELREKTDRVIELLAPHVNSCDLVYMLIRVFRPRAGIQQVRLRAALPFGDDEHVGILRQRADQQRDHAAEAFFDLDHRVFFNVVGPRVDVMPARSQHLAQDALLRVFLGDDLARRQVVAVFADPDADLEIANEGRIDRLGPLVVPWIVEVAALSQDPFHLRTHVAFVGRQFLLIAQVLSVLLEQRDELARSDLDAAREPPEDQRRENDHSQRDAPRLDKLVRAEAVFVAAGPLAASSAELEWHEQSPFNLPFICHALNRHEEMHPPASAVQALPAHRQLRAHLIPQPDFRNYKPCEVL